MRRWSAGGEDEPKADGGALLHNGERVGEQRVAHLGRRIEDKNHGEDVTPAKGHLAKHVHARHLAQLLAKLLVLAVLFDVVEVDDGRVRPRLEPERARGRRQGDQLRDCRRWQIEIGEGVDGVHLALDRLQQTKKVVLGNRQRQAV